MTTALITNKSVLEHEVPEDNPEVPGRLYAILSALQGEPFDQLMKVDASPASRHQAQRVHDGAYLDLLESKSPSDGFAQLDWDTHMSPFTLEAAYLAAGAACQGVDLVMQEKARNAFCAMRPPGHHAERKKAMGFCYLNSVAIAARHAQDAYGIERVAIIDFDVHHGNGTQNIFEDDASVLYASTHQMPLYPGTGDPKETGVGNILNIPLAVYDDGKPFRTAIDGRIVPALEYFQPQLLILSAGFDAHMDDPLGGLNLVEDDFIYATDRLVDVAEKHAGGRVVSVLEGGYNLSALASCTAAHVGALIRRAGII